MTKGAPRRSSIEKQIDESVARWVAAGLVIESGWTGSPLLVTKLPRGRAYHFDAEAVEKVLRFFALLRQTKGRWANQPFHLFDWQVRWEIAPIFGIKNAAGLRAIRTAWIEKPRKNGKSTECSGLALYLFAADSEPGAEVYAAAGDRPQAGIVFGAARQMALDCRPLQKRLGKGIQRSLLEHPVTHAIFRALSSDGARQHGLNVHGAVVDEVHVHKKPDLIDALETGTGSREQPLIVFITTADEGVDGSIYATKREYVDGLLAGTITDASWYAVIFAVDEKAPGFDAFSDETLYAANPGINLTTSLEYLRGKANEAKNSPAQLNRYLRLHLNVRTKQEVRWISLVDWDRAAGMANEAAWRDGIAYGGLDLSTTTDLTSFEMVLPGPGGLEGGAEVHSMFWLPEERAEQIEAKHGIPFKAWAAQGFIRLTEGNVVDYEQVRSDIAAEITRLGCHVSSIGYDPWNATETVLELEKAGFLMVPCRQGYATLSGPCKELERLIVGSTPEAPLLRHGGHPILRWNADCVAVRFDDNGNMKPVKPDRVKSTKRIDGIVALTMAIREATLGSPEESSAAGFLQQAMAEKAARETG